jgi:putative hydrolase of HD superfamily
MDIKSQIPFDPNILKINSPLVEVCFTIFRLKQLYRRGWLRSGIPQDRCESVADHILGVTMLAMIYADIYHPDLDQVKLLRMALIHDIGEIFAGDITPDDPISKGEKYILEKASITRIFSPLQLEREYLKIWEEYERGDSPEALLIWQIDKLEMVIQAIIYEKQENINLNEFYHSARSYLSDPLMIDIFTRLENLR